jgi:hypothetical protein
MPCRGRYLPITGALALSATLLAACGSSGGSAAAARPSACTRVIAVLSDGPDPGADPVGYAEAQILPLSQVHTDDGVLRGAIHRLDEAYRQEYSSNGSSASKAAVARAGDALNAICPGATS